LARTEADVDVTQKAVKTRAAFKIVRSEPKALLGLTSVVIGHIAMVTIMVMTPVHMGHVDVALRLIGLVISVHVLGMYAFSPLIGKLTDRIGREKTIILGAGGFNGTLFGPSFPARNFEGLNLNSSYSFSPTKTYVFP
jgi:MFS family permease